MTAEVNPAEVTVPILPCHSITAMLDFYQSLGFVVTYHQSRPNTYAAVARGGIELHFFSMKAYDPASSYSTCYVRVTDVDGLYQAFAGGLREALGKLPVKGIPRISQPKDKSYGVREFVVVDPGGNYIRIGQPLEKAEEGALETDPWQRALEMASALHDSKNDVMAAAKVLDTALGREGTPAPLTLARLLIARALVAHSLDDGLGLREMLGRLDGVSLNDREKSEIDEELAIASELRAG